MTNEIVHKGTIESGAHFSPCERYRYRLWRCWDASKWKLAIIGLNPSTATHEEDDPTIRRCIGFAKRDGYGGLLMLNLFALRSTDPKGLYGVSDPVGPANDAVLRMALSRDDRDGPVAAWGKEKIAKSRAGIVYSWLIGPEKVSARNLLRCFGKNGDGTPKHPLYLKGDTIITPFEAAPKVLSQERLLHFVDRLNCDG